MTARTAMLRVRVDNDTKKQATAALDAGGLSLSEAVRLFLKRVAADQALPLELKVPNAATRAAMAEADEIVAKAQGAVLRITAAIAAPYLLPLWG